MTATSIPRGYQQTDVGIIPKDWYTTTCAELSTMITVGIVIRPTQYYTARGVPALRSANVRESGIDPQDMVFITELANSLLSKSQLKAGDVVTVRTGYPGTSAVVPAAYSGANCIDILITRPKKAVSPQFLAAWINSPAGKNQVLQNQGGLAQQHFNVGELRELVVAIPPTKIEQEAIAGALSDADALIASLEQLLAKKRDIKQGAMQELLTGKKRLPGFSDKWEVKQLGNLLTICHGKSQKGIEKQDGKYPILATGGVIGRTNTYLCDTPSVLIGRKGTINRPQFMDTPFWSVDTLFYTKVNPPNNAKLLFYRFWLIDWNRYNEASGVPSLNARTIEQIEIELPESYEQLAIAETLTDMDAEISAIETKLEKARQIKQGMMQELLTGRIRLV